MLYFINEAAAGQRDLARRKLGDAYRGQLRLVGKRIDPFWEQRARDLDARAAAAFIKHCVRHGLADSVICLNRDGTPAYPALATPPQPDPTAGRAQWVEARRLEDGGNQAAAAEEYARLIAVEHDPATAVRPRAQAHIRCLAASGRKAAALRAIETHFDRQFATPTAWMAALSPPTSTCSMCSLRIPPASA